MAGTSLINGANYSISGGKCMIDGTVYNIGFGSNDPLEILGDGVVHYDGLGAKDFTCTVECTKIPKLVILGATVWKDASAYSCIAYGAFICINGQIVFCGDDDGLSTPTEQQLEYLADRVKVDGKTVTFTYPLGSGMNSMGLLAYG